MSGPLLTLQLMNCVWDEASTDNDRPALIPVPRWTYWKMKWLLKQAPEHFRSREHRMDWHRERTRRKRMRKSWGEEKKVHIAERNRFWDGVRP